MATAKTVKDRQNEIRENVMDSIKKASRFSVWDANKMNYHMGSAYKVVPMSEVERKYTNSENRKLYPASTMFVLKAVDCLTYASAEHIFKLLEFWRSKDKREVEETGKVATCIPNYEKMGDLWKAIKRLGDLGVMARYEFNECNPAKEAEGKPYYIYKVPSTGVMLYKTVLCYRGHSYDPKTAFYNPEDAFACCLSGSGLMPFLSSPYIKDVKFNQVIKDKKKSYKVKNVMTVNENGYGGKAEDDYKLIFEGVTFRTNQIVVSDSDRKAYVKERVSEVLSAVKAIREQKTPCYAMFIAEDSSGLSSLITAINSIDSDLLSYCLFTTGAILDDSDTSNNPSKVRDCFLNMEDGKLNGATGYYFLEWENK